MPVHNKSVILLQSMNFIVNLVRYPISDNGAVRVRTWVHVEVKSRPANHVVDKFCHLFLSTYKYEVWFRIQSSFNAIVAETGYHKLVLACIWSLPVPYLCDIRKKIYWCVDQVYDHVKKRCILTFNEKLE